MTLMSYQEALDWIHGIGKSTVIHPGLERIQTLLDKMGNPERSLNCIHIGGTNGKGSTAAMLASVLEEAGYRIGLYTSPYLESFTNRMSINGEDITPEELAREVSQLRPLVEEVSRYSGQGKVTEFEVVTALAFRFFAARQPDLVILEVGLGGRFDATNVISPLVSVITNVSLEHMDYLGNNVKDIAWQKAGIVKEEVPLVSASEDKEVIKVLREVCAKHNAPFYRLVSGNNNGNFNDAETIIEYGERKIVHGGQTFNYYGLKNNYRDLFIPLIGKHQVANAATVLAVLEKLGDTDRFKINDYSIKEGLRKVKWPGRLEILHKNPLVVLDGAHNPDAIEKLAEAIKEHFNYRRLILVLGILKDKDAAQMLGFLLPLSHEVLVAVPPIFRGADPENIASKVRQISPLPVEKFSQVENALVKALERASTEDMILVCGSLYMVAEARKYLLGSFTNS